MIGFTSKFRAAIVAAAIAASALAAGAAAAQTYPNGSVKLIVPEPAGGVTDTMARIVAQRLTETRGQPVIVDNRPGGNYGVGAQAVARARRRIDVAGRPDATITANPSLIGNWPYEAKEFTPIIVLCRASPVLVVNASVPAGTSGS